MNNHNKTSTFCEIRNSVEILLGLVVIEFLHFMDFGEIYFVVTVLVYAVGGYWIITMWKNMAIQVSVYIIKHISMFYLEVSIYS